LVISHHAAGNRRDCSIAAGGALRCGDIRKNEQGGCGKREIDHIGFHVAALTKLDYGVRVIRTQKLVDANSAQSSCPLVPITDIIENAILLKLLLAFRISCYRCPVLAAQESSCEIRASPQRNCKFPIGRKFQWPGQHSVAM